MFVQAQILSSARLAQSKNHQKKKTNPSTSQEKQQKTSNKIQQLSSRPWSALVSGVFGISGHPRASLARSPALLLSKQKHDGCANMAPPVTAMFSKWRGLLFVRSLRSLCTWSLSLSSHPFHPLNPQCRSAHLAQWSASWRESIWITVKTEGCLALCLFQSFTDFSLCSYQIPFIPSWWTQLMITSGVPAFAHRILCKDQF